VSHGFELKPELFNLLATRFRLGTQLCLAAADKEQSGQRT
jgi:hypothetical protein